jgi:ketosteroid isomerase-like protein
MSMSADEKTLREANEASARALMADFTMANWQDRLHADVVLEFPYAPTVHLPARIVGKADCVEYLHGIMSMAGGLQFRDPSFIHTTDPTQLIVEYSGSGGTPSGGSFSQSYITIQRWQDGKIIFFREYYDTKTVFDAFGGVLPAD